MRGLDTHYHIRGAGLFPAPHPVIWPCKLENPQPAQDQAEAVIEPGFCAPGLEQRNSVLLQPLALYLGIGEVDRQQPPHHGAVEGGTGQPGYSLQ